MIYFIQNTDDLLIKIGFSNDVYKRMKALAVTMGRLKMLGFHEGDRATESALHQRFNAHRCEGEWFNPHAEITAYIDAKCSIPFDDVVIGARSKRRAFKTTDRRIHLTEEDVNRLDMIDAKLREEGTRIGYAKDMLGLLIRFIHDNPRLIPHIAQAEKKQVVLRGRGIDERRNDLHIERVLLDAASYTLGLRGFARQTESKQENAKTSGADRSYDDIPF